MESPLATPADRAHTLLWLRFALVPGISPIRQRRLLRRFGTPDEVLARAPDGLEGLVGPVQGAALAQGADERLVDATIAWLDQPGRRLLALGDADYPAMLLEIPDPPTVLYASGRVELLASPAFAIVGSRNATAQGVQDAEGIARELSEAGHCIVSGLAHGIDAAAHRGGLAGRASSIAVIGTGPDRIYPRGNRALAERLRTEGCILSEFPLGTPPIDTNFPRRNRLISGLARGVLVVEAAERSGSLHTAMSALDQARDVFALPGSVHATLSKGCHRLIKEGATLVENARDVLDAYGLGKASAPPPSEPCEPPHPLLDAMGFAPACADQIARRCGLDIGTVASALSHLELEGRVRPLPGGWFQRVARTGSGGREAPAL